MIVMRDIRAWYAVAILLLCGNIAAHAQIAPPSPFLPPVNLPPPIPPPRIEIPVVPKLNAPPKANLKAPTQNSFGERVRRCLDDGAAGGLGPNERAAYSRACANQ
jgi:hypothetical protein